MNLDEPYDHILLNALDDYISCLYNKKPKEISAIRSGILHVNTIKYRPS